MSEDYAIMIEDCEKRESQLSDWERAFIDSINKQIGNGKTLTKSQADKLDDIWERVT